MSGVSEAVISPSASERYCSHMNQGHADAVLYYVQYFAKTHDVQKAQLLEVDSRGMNIEFERKSGKTETCRVAIDPEITSADELRPRLIAMMNEALDGLGLSRHQIDRFESPCPSAIFIGTIVCSFYFLLFTPITELPSTLASVKVIITSKAVYSWIAYSVLVIHALEVILILRPQVKKYRMGSRNALKWYLLARWGFLSEPI